MASTANCTPPNDEANTLLLLDGGMGHLLKQRGVRIAELGYDQQFLAGALANEQDPGAVLAAHADYAAAGARVLTTNTYAVTRHQLRLVSREADVPRLVRAAARLARRAADEASVVGAARVRVAGSLPPLGESYQSTGLPPPDELQAQYAEIVAALLADGGVDLLLAETLCSSLEARAAAAAAAAAGALVPLWVSFTLDDAPASAPALRGGEALADAAAALCTAHPHVRAVLVNCCAPAAVTAALPVLVAAVPPGVRVGAYANGFRTTTTQWLTGGARGEVAADPEDYGASGAILPAAYARHALGWRAAGASLVGGCCGVGPDHIAAVRSALAP